MYQLLRAKIFFRVHENIIIIGDPSETDVPDRRPRQASSETHLRPTCPIGDRTDLLETGMPNQNPTCMSNRRATCLIEDPSETDMPD